ncbi:cell shape-determining protein, partial [Clostridium tertium]
VPTEGTSLVYGNDNKAYWYTGITSSGGDESTIGFMLVDTRTKEAKLYKQPGATETAAMRSAEGKVQEKNYEATFPVMYNILGKPTYVSSLKDKAGLVKMVSFVSVEDFSVLGLGETKEEALRNYREALASKGNNIKIENDTTTDKL